MSTNLPPPALSVRAMHGLIPFIAGMAASTEHGAHASPCVDVYGFDLTSAPGPVLHQLQRAAQDADEAWKGKEASDVTVDDVIPFAMHHGFPVSCRARLWEGLTGALPLARNAGETTFARLSSCAAEELTAKCLRQIELDLPRTFCTQSAFRAAALQFAAEAVNVNCEAEVRQARSGTTVLHSLRRILRAVALACKPVGYTQGMNFVGGFALLVLGGEVGGLPDAVPADLEQRAFWLTLAIITRVLPGMYAEGMPTVRVMTKMLTSRLPEVLPGVHAVMDSAGFTADALAPRWMLCMWLNACPSPVVAHLWDFLFTVHAGAACCCSETGTWRGVPVANVPLSTGPCAVGPRLLTALALGTLRCGQEDLLACLPAGQSVRSALAQHPDAAASVVGCLQSLGANVASGALILGHALFSDCGLPSHLAKSLWEAARAAVQEEDAGAGGGSCSAWLHPGKVHATLNAASPATPPMPQPAKEALASPSPRTPAPVVTGLVSPRTGTPSAVRRGTGLRGMASPLAQAMLKRHLASPSPAMPLSSPGVTPPVQLPAPSVASDASAGSPWSPSRVLYGLAQPAGRARGTPLGQGMPHTACTSSQQSPVDVPATPLPQSKTPRHVHPLASPEAGMKAAALLLQRVGGLSQSQALALGGPFGFGALCPTAVVGEGECVLDLFVAYPPPTDSPIAPAPATPPTRQSTHKAPVRRSLADLWSPLRRPANPPRQEPVAGTPARPSTVASVLQHVDGSPAARRSAAEQAQQSTRTPLRGLNRLFSPARKPAPRAERSADILLSPVARK